MKNLVRDFPDEFVNFVNRIDVFLHVCRIHTDLDLGISWR
jgi:hypothetical protein